MTGRRRYLDSNSRRQRVSTDDHRLVRELRSGHQQIQLDRPEEQDTASSAVAELDSLIDNLDSSIISIEEDSKEVLDEFREFCCDDPTWRSTTVYAPRWSIMSQPRAKPEAALS